MEKWAKTLYFSGVKCPLPWRTLELDRSWVGAIKPLKFVLLKLDIWMAFSCIKKHKNWSFYVKEMIRWFWIKFQLNYNWINLIFRFSFPLQKEVLHVKFTLWLWTNQEWLTGDLLPFLVSISSQSCATFEFLRIFCAFLLLKNCFYTV